MVTWSYEMRVVLLGNAVFVSMDVPDVLLAVRARLSFQSFFLRRPLFQLHDAICAISGGGNLPLLGTRI
jgi:hypothetical protein